MKKSNPTRKNFPLNQLHIFWTPKNNHQPEEVKPVEVLKRFAGKFKNKDLTNVAIKQGKKVYVKTVEGFVQLSLSN